jgi:GT2 family glycosyltransferase
VRIGIVVPTLGEPERLDLLRDALRSIDSQTGADVTVVLSTVPARVDALKALFPEHVVVPQVGRGIAAAIETGWGTLPADIQLVAWLGDDDRLTPGALAATARALEVTPRAAMVFGRCRYIDLSGAEICETRPGRVAVPLLQMGANLIGQPGALYRRSAVVAVGGLDQNLALAFDVDLHLRLSRHARLAYLPRVLGEARVHPGSLTTAQRGRSQAEAAEVMSRGRTGASSAVARLSLPAVRLASRVTSKVSTRAAG